jgi:Zn-dependent protease
MALRDGAFGEELLFDVLTGQTWEGWYLALLDLVFVNVWWSLVNLLPIRPLDGGNVMTEVVGVSTARVVSMGVAAAGAVYAWSIGETYVAFFAVLLGFMNFSERQAEQQRPA